MTRRERTYTPADIRALWFALLAAVVAVLMSVYAVVTLLHDREDLVQRLRDQAAVCQPARQT